MQKQILAKLEIKFPGLSKAFLGLIATQLATKVTEESGIDTAIAELDNAPIPIPTLAVEFQKEGDRRVTEAAAKKPKPEVKPEEKPKEEATTATDPNKELADLVKSLNARLEKMETERSTGSRRAQLEAKLVNVPEKTKAMILKGFAKMKFENDEEFETYLTETEADVADFPADTDVKTTGGLGKQPKPVVSKGSNSKEASKEEIDAVLKRIM